MRQTIRSSGIQRSLSSALAPWRNSRAAHDPAKVLLDVAVAVALGGDCLADVAVVRAQSELFGSVASAPTVSRVVGRLAADVDTALPAIRAAHADARAAAWARRRPLAGSAGSRDGGQVIVDLDSTLVTSHSEKERAQPTYKRGFGHAPMCAFVDHGERGTGETLALQLRPGKASPFDKGDHIEALDLALVQLPEGEREQVLVRADTGACSKAFLHYITDLGWSTPSDSPPWRPSRVRSRPSRPRRGVLRSTPMANRGKGRRSPSSPRGCPIRSRQPGPARRTGRTGCE